MRKFEGNINGKIYTDEKEFDKALSTLERTDLSLIQRMSQSFLKIKTRIRLLLSVIRIMFRNINMLETLIIRRMLNLMLN